MYSTEDLQKSKNISNLKKFYETVDHFLEVVVLLNKCCSRNTDIDDLDIDLLRYFLSEDFNSVYDSFSKLFDGIEDFRISAKYNNGNKTKQDKQNW